MKNLLFWKKPDGPSEEAQEALARAKEIREKSDKVYAERAYWLNQNHFAERIRLLYVEGR